VPNEDPFRKLEVATPKVPLCDALEFVVTLPPTTWIGPVVPGPATAGGIEVKKSASARKLTIRRNGVKSANCSLLTV
jgi:hypothetical protein